MDRLDNLNIALLGATGHIAKTLIYFFNYHTEHKLYLFARSPEIVKNFASSLNCFNKCMVLSFDDFMKKEYDVIINCIGIGDPNKLKNCGEIIFRLTEKFDNLILDYINIHPKTIYINFSSGAAYGTDFSLPVNEKSQTSFNVNCILAHEYYSLAKINSEAKHRAMTDSKIIDLRIFGFFSRFIDQQANYLINDIIYSTKSKTIFYTNSENIIRDYVYPEDLFLLIHNCVIKKPINDVYDVYSLKPVKKFELLEYFTSEYDLKYKIIGKENNMISPTGNKVNYYSTCKKAELIGYFPKLTSLESIKREAGIIINDNKQ